MAVTLTFAKNDVQYKNMGLDKVDSYRIVGDMSQEVPVDPKDLKKGFRQEDHIWPMCPYMPMQGLDDKTGTVKSLSGEAYAIITTTHGAGDVIKERFWMPTSGFAFTKGKYLQLKFLNQTPNPELQIVTPAQVGYNVLCRLHEVTLKDVEARMPQSLWKDKIYVEKQANGTYKTVIGEPASNTKK